MSVDQVTSSQASQAANREKTGIAAKILRAPKWLLALILPALTLAVWQFVTTTGIVAPWTLPTPASVVTAAIELTQDGDLGKHIGISTQRVLLGFFFGSLLGLALGALVGLSKLADALLGLSISALRAVPSLAWVPLLVLWMKMGEDSKVTLVIIGAFFPVFTTVALALRHVDAQLVEAARAFGLNGLKLLRTVQLPAVVPSIFSGLRLALAQAWLFLVAAELLGASMGLGFLLTDSQNNGRLDRLIMTIVLLAVFGKITDALLSVAERWAIKRWT